MKSKRFIAIILYLIVFAAFVEASQATDLFPVRKDDEFGYVDRTGKVIIPFRYDDAWQFSEGLASVEIDRKRGYIDRKGKIIIGLQFEWANSFRDGLAKVITADSYGLAGFIDKSGKVVIKPQFREVDNFSNGLAVFQMNSLYGFIDTSGRTVVEPQFSYAHPFSEGLACVRLDEKWGFIDKTGKFAVPPRFDDASSFSEGVGSVQLAGKHLFIDKKGRSVIEPGLDYPADQFFGGQFSEGWVRWPFYGGKWGYLDKNGSVAVSPLYDCTWDFSEGLARVQIADKWAFIDKAGTIVIQPKAFAVVTDFSNGMASGITVDNEEILFDKTGKTIWTYRPGADND